MDMYNVRNELMLRDVSDKFDADLVSAVASVNREDFLPDSLKHLAYTLGPIPVGGKQFISSPLTVLKMTSHLFARDVRNLKVVANPDNVLEVGLGSGYQAVVLSKLFRRVFGIERIQSLYDAACARVSKLGIMNIIMKFDDGNKGWERHSPYDRILFSACATGIPDVIFDQLSRGGVLVTPFLDGDKQFIKRYVKLDSASLYEENLGPCEFVPIISGIETYN